MPRGAVPLTQPANKRKVVVVSHTHWDREWYLPFQEFRWKLVKLMDEILSVLRVSEKVTPDQGQREQRIASSQTQAIDRRADGMSGSRTAGHFPCFMLDGQTILLEDYLELRPDKREELRQLVSSGRILIGPWYVLPDEFLVSGEALIRNLLMGDEVARQFGKVMQVGYLPDQFGHISQMPQILRGFGLDSAVIWRGVGDEVGKTEFIWGSPDGSGVLTLHLATGYFNGQLLPTDTQEFLERIATIRERLESKASTEYVVVMNGGDHHFVQAELPAVLKAASQQLHDAELTHSCLPQLMEGIRESLDASGADIPTVRGELRNCKQAHLLPGVLSSRMWIKQRNSTCENLLEKWAEPLSAWAAAEAPPSTTLEDREYSELDTPSAKLALKLAWKQLLQNQPHDSICGCSIDQVHEEMIARFNSSEGIAEGVVRQAMERIASYVDTASIPKHRAIDADGQQTCVVVFNPAEGPRTEFVTFTVRNPDGEKFAIIDGQGNIYPCQVLDRRINPVTSLPEIDFGFVAPTVPGFGYKAFRLVPDVEPQPYEGVAVGAKSIENESFRVEVDGKNGTLQVMDKLAGRLYEGLNMFVDGGDAGDEYNYDAPLNDSLVMYPDDTPKVLAVDRGPCRFALKIDTTLSIPAKLANDRRSRAADRVKLPITSVVTLYPGVRRIDIHTEVDNVAKDHRLRVHFPTGIDSDHTYADGHFAIERRRVQLPDRSPEWVEDPVGTYPQKTFVDVNDGQRGMMIANRGLPEYEALRTNDGLVVALTLLRCTGWLSRDDLTSRRGPAGPIIPAPGGQCPGSYAFDYSLIPHPSGWQEASLEARRFNSPMRAQPTSTHSGHLPRSLGFISIRPCELVISAIKLAEQGDDVIVRFYNPTSHRIQAKISTYRPFATAKLVDLHERPLTMLARDTDSTTLDLAESQIATVRFEFRRGIVVAQAPKGR